MGLTNRWPSQTNTDIETEGYLLGIILYAHSQQNWNQIQRSHARKIAVIMKQIHLLAVSLTPDYRYESAMYNTQYHNSSVMKENCITGILTCWHPHVNTGLLFCKAYWIIIVLFFCVLTVFFLHPYTLKEYFLSKLSFAYHLNFINSKDLL